MQVARRCLVALVILTACGSVADAGPIFDVAADFSKTDNPTGPWSYGYSTTLGGALTLYTVNGNFPNPNGSPTGLDGWWENISLFNPAAVKNNTGGLLQINGTANYFPGRFGLHPGPNGEFSIARWTAPQDGDVTLASVFTGIDRIGTTTDVHVLFNGTALFDGLVEGDGDTEGFDAAIAVSQGDTIDFAVGFGSNRTFFFDSTGLGATITYAGPAAVPEPASVGLVVAGAAGLLGYARRRRASRG